jgi:murein DD-endopeptidase MepM/ murein hydrolase activator NlpD
VFPVLLRRFPASLRGAAAVTVLGAVVATLLVSGRPAPVRAASYGQQEHAVSASREPSLAAVPDVSDSLQLFGLAATAAPARANRSEHRAAVRDIPPAHRWVRPNGGPLSSPFGYRWGRLHAGIDLAGPWGSAIVAATDGCITYAGPMSGYGEVMMISDWDGTETVYGHMSSFVKRSGCVHAGEEIARVGEGGDATGPHLHFEIRVGGAPVNPIPFLAKRGLYI